MFIFNRVICITIFVCVNIIVLSFKQYCDKVSADAVLRTLIVADICDSGKISCALLLDDDVEIVESTYLFHEIPSIGDTIESWVYHNCFTDKWEILSDTPKNYQATSTLAVSIIITISIMFLIGYLVLF